MLKLVYTILFSIYSFFVGTGNLVGIISNGEGGVVTITANDECIDIAFTQVGGGAATRHETICEHNMSDIQKIEATSSGLYLYVVVQENYNITTHAIQIPSVFIPFTKEQANDYILYIPVLIDT